MNQFKRFSILPVLAAILLLTSCGGSSVTNVWDYYVTNEVIQHKAESPSVSKRKLLYRDRESVKKSQLELIAVRQDDNAYLVIGSHKIAKSFLIHDSVYAFDVTDLYSRVRGDDFIRQMGDLNIFFTHIPASKCNEFLSNLEPLKKQFMDAKVSNGATTQIDFYLAHNVFVSFEKTRVGQSPSKCVLWVGRRRHEMSLETLVKVLTELKNFN